jgi:hypothetical protein
MVIDVKFGWEDHSSIPPTVIGRGMQAWNHLIPELIPKPDRFIISERAVECVSLI